MAFSVVIYPYMTLDDDGIPLPLRLLGLLGKAIRRFEASPLLIVKQLLHRLGSFLKILPYGGRWRNRFDSLEKDSLSWRCGRDSQSLHRVPLVVSYVHDLSILKLI